MQNISLLSNLYVIVALLMAAALATQTSASVSEHKMKLAEKSLPFSLKALQFLKKLEESPMAAIVNKQAKSGQPSWPMWPLEFNCTLQKINPDDHEVQWTKLYYDYKHSRTNFDFFDWYYDTDGKWGAVNYRIIFINSTIWFDYPKERSCQIRAKDIPTISPDWLKWTVYKGRGLFREMYSDLFEFPEGMGSLTGIKYYHRVASKDDDKIPLRSTNQEGDPGITDYTDFAVGPQSDDHFELPYYCPKV